MAGLPERLRWGFQLGRRAPVPESVPQDELDRTWSPPPGIVGQLTTVQNQIIAPRFISAAFAFFLFGGIFALLIRAQLTVPENQILDARTYNQAFTMHGTTMMFLFAVPIIEAFATFLLPAILGSRELPFPRMTAFGFWSFLFGGLLFYSSVLFGAMPDGGWFAYVPLTGPVYSPGLGTDFWLMALNVAEVAAIGAGAELMISVLKMRAPGMTLDRIPIFGWSILVMGLAIIFAFTPLIVGTILLELDRKFGTRFFDPAAGGDPLLWQHLFWIFGHPEVYIQFIPAAGMISMIIPTFTRQPLVAHRLVVMSIIATGFISFGLWVHHMFTVGIALLAFAFFSAASLTIAIPNGIQFFAWIGTIWRGRPVFRTPMLFALGFLFTFLLGGLTGVMVAIVPFDWQVHDSFFVVAHFHYVLVGGVVFPIFAGLHYWIPAMTGRLLSETIGRWTFWLILVGFHLGFFPMHILGLLGMPRRVFTYDPSLGWGPLNLLSTIGVGILTLGILAFLWNVVHTFVLGRGRPSGNDPWGGGTLEWAVGAPPPNVGWRQIPIIRSRYPVWEQDRLDSGNDRYQRLVRTLAERPTNYRAALVTSVLDARPEAIIRIAGPSWWPLLLSLGLVGFYAATIFDLWWLTGLSAVWIAISTISWLWPSREERMQARARSTGEADDTIEGVPLGYAGRGSPAWWAMAVVVLVVAVIVASLVFSYFYLQTGAGEWPPPGVPQPAALLPAVATGVLAASTVAIWLAVRAIRAGSQTGVKLWLLGTIALGIAFVAIMVGHLVEALGVGLDWRLTAYGSAFFTLTGATILLAGLGLIILAVTTVQAVLGYFSEHRNLAVENTALFWSAVLGSWLVIAAVLHLSPMAF